MKKKLAVLWSGGCDSTVILHYLLNNKDIVENYEIRTFSFDINKPLDETESRDKQARKQILVEFEKRKLPTFNHTEHILSQKEPVATIHTQNGGYSQQSVWACISPIYLYPDEDLYIGYIRGDDAVNNRELSDAFYTCQKTMGHTGLLYYPLSLFYKEEILNYLIKHNLRSLVNTCSWLHPLTTPLIEKDYYKLFPTPCWSCISCKKILQANLLLEKFPQDLRDIKLIVNKK